MVKVVNGDNITITEETAANYLAVDLGLLEGVVVDVSVAAAVVEARRKGTDERIILPSRFGFRAFDYTLSGATDAEGDIGRFSAEDRNSGLIMTIETNEFGVRTGSITTAAGVVVVVVGVVSKNLMVC